MGGGTSNPCKIGAFNVTADNQTVDVNDVGFKPKQIAIVFQGSNGSGTSASNGCIRMIYDERIANNTCHRGLKNASSEGIVSTTTLTNSGAIRISEVNDNGFKYCNDSSTSIWRGTYYYFAIG